MFAWIAKWFSRRLPGRVPGQSCQNCRYFIDYTDPDDDPDEVNGYCSFDYVNNRLHINPYGGHWTHSKSWCRDWEGGEAIWQPEPVVERQVAGERCQHCSFDPTSMSDYCDKHRPK